MKQVLIRDDDANFFTDPQQLQQVHAPLLDAGGALNLAVIPQVAGDAAPPNNESVYFRCEGLRYEPFLPPHVRGTPQCWSVADNAALCRFVRDSPNVEVLQHGVTHKAANARCEFDRTPTRGYATDLAVGRQTLTEAFGRAPTFFAPPADAISPAAIDLLRPHFRGVSLKSPRRRLLRWWQQARVRRSHDIGAPWLLSGQFLLVGHPGYVVNRFHHPDYVNARLEELLAHSEAVVLVVHHWEFFFDWEQPNVRLFNAWHDILRRLSARADVRFVTFSEFYEGVFLSTNRKRINE